MPPPRLEDLAGNFATARNLAAHFRRFPIEKKFIRMYERKAQYFRVRFAFALAAELDRDLFMDEVDCALFLQIGSGAL